MMRVLEHDTRAVADGHDGDDSPTRRRLRAAGELLIGFSLLFAGVELAMGLLGAPPMLRVSAGGLYLALAVVLVGPGEAPPARLGWANRVTLLRAALVLLIAGLLVFPEVPRNHPYAVFGLALTALLLDGVDGWVARRTRSITAFGARFDMELDAFFILVLCIGLVAIDRVGPWVLGIGLARYLFVCAGRVLAWMRRPLPPSGFRKVVCVWQVVTLLLCLLPSMPAAAASGAAAMALSLLVVSFGRDLCWLLRQRHHGRPRDASQRSNRCNDNR